MVEVMTDEVCDLLNIFLELVGGYVLFSRVVSIGKTADNTAVYILSISPQRKAAMSSPDSSVR